MHDVVHEVFRAVFEERARTSYSGLTPFGGYLFVVTKNVVMKRLRREDRTRPLEPETLEEVPTEGATPEAIVSRLEAAVGRRDFAGATALLDQLPEAMQAAAGSVGTDIRTLAAADGFIAILRARALEATAEAPAVEDPASEAPAAEATP